MNTKDEKAIVALLLRYATAIDRRDWQLFSSCFTEDLVADYDEIGRWRGREAFVNFMEKGHAELGPTLHRMTNFVITGEAKQAAATSYVDALLMARVNGREIYRQAHGWYDDQLVRRKQAWKIMTRRFVPVLICENAYLPRQRPAVAADGKRSK